jgi:hypothetical protein
MRPLFTGGDCDLSTNGKIVQSAKLFWFLTSLLFRTAEGLRPTRERQAETDSRQPKLVVHQEVVVYWSTLFMIAEVFCMVQDGIVIYTSNVYWDQWEWMVLNVPSQLRSVFHKTYYIPSIHILKIFNVFNLVNCMQQWISLHLHQRLRLGCILEFGLFTYPRTAI